MPPYIDGIHEPGQLFFCTGDGKYVPFTGIQEAVIMDEVKTDPGCVLPSWTETGELCFTARLTKQSSKAWKKLFRPIMQKRMRAIRKYKRKKEKIRRMILKSGGICIL